MAGATGRQGVVRPPASGTPRLTRKAPAVAPYERRDDIYRDTYRDTPDERNDGWDSYDERYGDSYDDPEESGRRWRQNSAARPLALQRVSDPELWAAGQQEALPVQELTPDLAMYRPRSVAPRSVALRTQQATRALVRSARSPWARVRFALAILAICIGLWTAISAAGEASQPLMATWTTTSGSHDARAITTLVQAETQGTRPDLYDSQAQFSDWWDAACSAAVMSEVLTAWGAPHATIGKMIDVMQPDISLNGGLLTTHGFVRGASALGYRADISSGLTYKQMLYLTNTLGLPVIVNVRISYGYYHFFSGGHFLVMTGGDSQGLKIVDSSEYYIKYLPLDTFNSMFTGITAVVVPNGYTYSLPS